MSVNDLRCGKRHSKAVKVTPKMKRTIRREYSEGSTIAAIARKYLLSWTTIKYVVDDEYRQRMTEYNRNYVRKRDKEKYNNILRRHRDYKRQLHKEGKI